MIVSQILPWDFLATGGNCSVMRSGTQVGKMDEKLPWWKIWKKYLWFEFKPTLSAPAACSSTWAWARCDFSSLHWQKSKRQLVGRQGAAPWWPLEYVTISPFHRCQKVPAGLTPCHQLSLLAELHHGTVSSKPTNAAYWFNLYPRHHLSHLYVCATE